MIWNASDANWRRLPRKAMAAPSLEVSKTRLDVALMNLVWWKVPISGSWNMMVIKVPSNPSQTMIARLPALRWAFLGLPAPLSPLAGLGKLRCVGNACTTPSFFRGST